MLHRHFEPLTCGGPREESDGPKLVESEEENASSKDGGRRDAVVAKGEHPDGCNDDDSCPAP